MTVCFGTRLNRPRRAVGDCLIGFRTGDRLGNTLDRKARVGTDWLKRLCDLAHSLTGRIHEVLERFAERQVELQTLDERLQQSLNLAKVASERLGGQRDSREARAERSLRH